MNKQYCTFRVGNEVFGVDVNWIQEIINLPSFTKIPRSKEYISGVYSLRGQIVTNFSINSLFKINSNADYHHCIVLIKEPDPISVDVHEVLDILDIETSKIENCPEMIEDSVRQYFLGIVKQNDQIITLLDVEKLSY